ncbi:hypothetical protein [Coprothermobacter platensis]|uniref:hypothetical protein n=1 Tax=Coprothermobacter platensis TaxID=108819 RepID=UPI0012E9ED8F|nr:hypothetical protein [Coprothermobacter platensis]
MNIIMVFTICVFVLIFPLIDTLPRNTWAVKLSDMPLFSPPKSQEETRLIFATKVLDSAKQESDLESHIRIPIIWNKDQTIINVLTGCNAGLNNFRTTDSTVYTYALSHLDGYTQIANAPKNLSLLQNLGQGNFLKITFVGEVSQLEPGDIVIEMHSGALNLYGLIVVKQQLPQKTQVKMDVYDIMPLVSNLAGIPYPPAGIGTVPWDVLPFNYELKAYRNFFLLRQKLVLADGISTSLFGTSKFTDIESYKPGISYYEGDYEKAFSEEQEMISEAMQEINAVARQKWLLDMAQRWYWFLLGALFLSWRFNLRMVPVTIGLLIISTLLGGFLFKFSPLFLVGPAIAIIPLSLIFPDMDSESIFYMCSGVVLIWMGLYGARRYIISPGSVSAFILWSTFSVAFVAGLFTVFRKWQEIWS